MGWSCCSPRCYGGISFSWLDLLVLSCPFFYVCVGGGLFCFVARRACTHAWGTSRWELVQKRIGIPASWSLSVSLFLFTFHSFFFYFYFSFTGNRIPPPPPGSVCVCIYTGAAAARFQEKKVKIIIRNETSGSDSKSFLNKNWPSSFSFFCEVAALFVRVWFQKGEKKWKLQELFTCWENLNQ
jgi:hypothetical protein